MANAVAMVSVRTALALAQKAGKGTAVRSTVALKIVTASLVVASVFSSSRRQASRSLRVKASRPRTFLLMPVVFAHLDSLVRAAVSLPARMTAVAVATATMVPVTVSLAGRAWTAASALASTTAAAAVFVMSLSHHHPSVFALSPGAAFGVMTNNAQAIALSMVSA
jgi:hypothetical protein